MGLKIISWDILASHSPDLLTRLYLQHDISVTHPGPFKFEISSNNRKKKNIQGVPRGISKESVVRAPMSINRCLPIYQQNSPFLSAIQNVFFRDGNESFPESETK